MEAVLDETIEDQDFKNKKHYLIGVCIIYTGIERVVFFYAPVVQRTECRFPEPKMEVQFSPGAQKGLWFNGRTWHSHCQDPSSILGRSTF